MAEERWVDVCAAADLSDGEAAVVIDDEEGEIAVFRVGDEYFGLEDRCSHQEAALSDGFVEGCAVECPLHASLFDLRTGVPTGLPATRPVPTYRVQVAGGRVVVDAASGVLVPAGSG